MAKVSFNNKANPFFQELKGKVDDYFLRTQLQPSGNKNLFLKGVLQTCTAIALYIVLVFFTPGIILSLFLCILFGLNLALLGFNVMHEGSHQSFSKHRWVNHISAYFLNGLGGNSYFWKLKHNIAHHTYTNIEGMDADIEIGPLMRLHENQPRYWFHKFQHLYWIFLYGFTYLTWVFYEDYEKYFTGKISRYGVSQKWELKEHFIFWGSKLLYLSVYLVLPIFMLGFVDVIIGFAVISFFCGLFISVVFQLAHIVEGTHFPTPDKQSNKIEEEWAIHQVNTTADFATKSKVVSWLLGGLNFQVEHHLFPKISHVHYPKIRQFVKETCEKFNVQYIEYPSFLRALQAHIFHIRRLGRAI